MNIDSEIERHIQKYLNEFAYEAELLAAWFKQDFPESDLKVDLNYDTIYKTMTLKTRVLTKQETKDRGLFENKIVMHEKDFFRHSFVSGVIAGVNSTLRQNISVAVNNHYQNEKMKGELIGQT